jgi:hypothetical protein
MILSWCAVGMLAASDRMRVVLARPTEPNRYISKRLGVALTRPERRRFQTQKKERCH